MFAKSGKGAYCSISDVPGVPDVLGVSDSDSITLTALVTYCKNEGIPYTEFKDFTDILTTVKAIVSGEKTVKDVVVSA